MIVTALRTPTQLKITVWDQGKGFDLEALPDPLSPEMLLNESGRGIYLARAFMDEFHLETGRAGGATVSLVKYIRKSKNCVEYPVDRIWQAIES